MPLTLGTYIWTQATRRRRRGRDDLELLTPGTYNWTQVANTEDGMADRMSREALIYVGSPPEETWDQIGSGEDFDFRGFLDAQTAEAVTEIEREAGFELKFREADVGRGASGSGTVVEIVEAVAIAGGAVAAVRETARLVRWAYHRIASAGGHRPMISLGAARVDVFQREQLGGCGHASSPIV